MAHPTPEETLQLGMEMTRAQIIDRFGGRPQGAISPSRTTATVVVLTGHRPLNDPTHPVDGFTPDGILHLTGEGSRGDQEMKQANKALLNAKAEGRVVLVFHAISGTRSRKTYRYIGQFELDAEQPYYLTDAADPNGGTRRVIVFRLKPVGEHADGIPQLPEITPPPSTTLLTPARTERMTAYLAEPIDSEPLGDIGIYVDSARIHRLAEPYGERVRPRTTIVRREASLTAAFAAHLQRLGHQVVRRQINVPGVRNPFITDLMDDTTNTLYEVKNSASRGEIRTAIGQLLDFQRFLDAPALGVVLPSEPYPDLIDLCTGLSIEVIWPVPDTGGFTSSKH
ncbi:hypothetical protein GCM10009664_22930 [Kitasatospora gansuensis]